MRYKNEHATEIYDCKKKGLLYKKNVYQFLKLNNIIEI